MYDNYPSATGAASASRRRSDRHWQCQWHTTFAGAVAALVVALVAAGSASAQLQTHQNPSVLRRISDLSEKLELITNTSRILTLDKPIPRVQVNNPELLAVTPLSATQIQVSAKKAGVTQVNLWDEDGNIHTVDVLIYGDARELEVALQTQFPHSSIRVYRYSESLVLSGFVDNPTHVSHIKLLAEDYAPKVIMNINVGGVQQILLKVKVMEISRTRLRELKVDWAFAGENGGFVLNSVSEILTRDAPNILTNNDDTFAFGIVDNGDTFLGFLKALQENGVGKILAEPNIVAVSGRPAQFNVGGEFPIVIPQSLGTSSIEYKPFGTQIDFLPIVLGNGNVRLEVRPRVSDLDFSVPVDLNGIILPALDVRQVDTAVEMKAGQTFAIAGLIQEKSKSRNRGLPYLASVPIFGVPFRGTENEVEEIELLILVTPEFVDPLDAHLVACGGPGYGTTNPTNEQLYCAGHVEVPAHCNPIFGPLACGECGGPAGNCQCGTNAFSHGHIHMHGGAGYDQGTNGAMHSMSGSMQPVPTISDSPQPGGPVRLPANGAPQQMQPAPMPVDLPLPSSDSAMRRRPVPQVANRNLPVGSGTAPRAMMVPRPYTPPRQPVYLRNAPIPNNPQPAGASSSTAPGQSGLIGPVGYDAQ
jgi:pilus assembly protein CpaC